MKREYSFDSNIGVSICTLYDTKFTSQGIAICHDDDKAFMSERTGLQIAEARAEINMLKMIRDYELTPALIALQHLQTNMTTSKHYNPKSYEARMLRRQVNIKQNEIKAVQQEIKVIEEFLENYITSKNKLYNKDKKD